MRNSRVIAILFGLVCVLALVVVRAFDPYPVRAMRNITFDQIQRVLPRPFGDYPVRVVDIDEYSLGELGQWPWPRDILAALVDRLGELGAATIIFDVIFPEPDRLSPHRLAANETIAGTSPDVAAQALADSLPDNDRLFADAIARNPVVLGFGVIEFERRGAEEVSPHEAKSGFALLGIDPMASAPAMSKATRNLPVLEEAAAGLGSISLSPGDAIDVVRRIPLVWSDGNLTQPSLVMEALRVAQGASTMIIKGSDEVAGSIESVRVGDFTIPTTSTGDIWIWYDHDRPERYVAAADVLSGSDEALAPLIAGQIVLVGTSATGLLDIRPTALGENVPGVSIHAQVLEQIISNAYLHRAEWVQGLEILIVILIGLLLVISSLFSGPIMSFFLGALSAVSTLAVTWAAFQRWGVLIDPSYALAGGMFIYLALTSFRFLVSDREKRQIRKAFVQYVAPSVLEEIESNPDSLKLGGEIRTVSVMFVDVRNFTPLSEKLRPADLLTLLNRLLSALSDKVIEESGTIDKYIGDSVMAFWNAPINIEHHEYRACLAALKMRVSLRALNESNAFATDGEDGDPHLIAIAIGMCTGEACVGNMGSEQRFDYSVIGDTVNVAARVENACRHVAFDIMMAKSTQEGIAQMATLFAGSIALKGKTDRLSLHILVGDDSVAESQDFKTLQSLHDRLVNALIQTGRIDHALLSACQNAGHSVLPELVDFYERISERTEDYLEQVSTNEADLDIGATALIADRV